MTADSPSRPRRDLWSFGRSDRWGLLALLALVAVGTAAGQILAPVVGWVRGTALTVPYVSAIDVPALDGTGVAYGEGRYDVSVPDPTAAQRLLDLVPGLLLAAVVVTGCWLVVRIMRGIADGDPFRRRNVTRLRGLALLIAIGLPTVWFTRLPVDLALLGSLDLGGGGPAAIVEVPWAPVVVGTAVALVAEAFRTGAGLHDDLEGLV